MTMEHVITSIAEEIFHALFALNHGPDSSTELALQPNLSGVLLHNIFRDFRGRCVAVSLVGEVNYFVIGVEFVGQRRCRWSDSIRLVRL